ncbi:unnamed protein product [Polarella glacialis]|uniref:Calmodulin n=1 Tax=Polarella glacialis TaxID=89957 RepID=A0A813KSD7_POLGL|nr:unnamed protein product [Polarella glacialis]
MTEKLAGLAFGTTPKEPTKDDINNKNMLQEAMAPLQQQAVAISDLLKKKRLRASDLFKKIDASGAKEFERAVRAAEKNPSKKERESIALAKTSKKGLVTEDDHEEFRQIFCLFKQLSQSRMEHGGDENVGLVEWDESGSITIDDLEQLLETVGMKLTGPQLEAMVKEIDLDGDGNIDFNEFCSTMTKKIQIDYEPEDVGKAFRAFSRNAPEGMIRVTDLKNALTTYMHRELVEAEVEELVFHYKDSFITLPGSDTEYFRYQSYIDLMSPLSDRAPQAE